MRRPFIAGNWKMHGDIVSIETLIQDMVRGLAGYDAAEVAVFPSFVYLPHVRDLLKHSSIGFGGQNLCNQASGAYTGEISAAMLRDVGCHYVLIGHSERRHIYGESNNLIAEKFAIALEHGLTPVLCIGETQGEREANKTHDIVTEQLEAVLSTSGITALAQSIVAYEPVWAIGTGLTATPEQAQDVHAFIRNMLAQKDATIASEFRIVYGGSVKPNNAADLFNMPDIDGGLIGGASLKAESFIDICQAMSK